MKLLLRFAFVLPLLPLPLPAQSPTPPDSSQAITVIQSPIAGMQMDPAKLKEFFASLEETDRELYSKAESLTEEEKSALVWLTQNISMAKTNQKGDYKFILSKVKMDSAYAKTLKKYHEKKFPALSADKEYIQIQYIATGSATPEYHGVIELEGPKLLNLWMEYP